MSTQVRAALNGPVSNLLSGLLGAMLGVVGLFAVQGLQSRATRREARAAARLIYLEIGYNVAAIQALATAATPIPLLVASGEWERHSQKLAAVMSEHETARIAFPYIQLNAYRLLFAQKWYFMAVTRLRDGDLKILKQMSLAFRDAEAALRPAVWTGPRLEALTTVAAASAADPFAPRSLRRRLLLAVSDVPVEFSSAVVATLLLIQVLLRGGDSVERWIGRLAGINSQQRQP